MDALERHVAEGQSLLSGGVAPSAIASFQKAISRNPFYLPALEGIAEAYEQIGQTERAQRYRRRIDRLHEMQLR
jgi:Tfp pilus assembly protein PilF